MMIILRLPPSLNTLYRRSKWGGMYMTQDGKRWKEYAAWEIKSVIKQQMKKVVIKVRAFFPDWRRKDLDGLCKLIGDSLVMAGVIKDDNWQTLNEWHMIGHLSKENPRLELDVIED